MPVKHQPDYVYLKLVRLNRVHLFTVIQLLAFVLLCFVKYTKAISMLFPILVTLDIGNIFIFYFYFLNFIYLLLVDSISRVPKVVR